MEAGVFLWKNVLRMWRLHPLGILIRSSAYFSEKWKGLFAYAATDWRRSIYSNRTFNVLYVTGFWKTDRNVTLGLFHFIGPANAYTHTLHIRTAIIRLGWLVCFSRVTFADPVNSWLGQWDPWRALHGRHGCEIHLMDGETSITPFKRVWTYDWLFWDS